jgi:hypothetical protein
MPATVVFLESPGLPVACIGRAKEEKYFKVRNGRHMAEGQEMESYPNL